MFKLKEFAEKNNLHYNNAEIEEMQRIYEANDTVGLVCRGQIEGMVPRGIESLGINTIFDNGIYIGIKKEEPCKGHTLYLIPRAVKVCVISDLEDLSEALCEFSQKIGIFPESIGEVIRDRDCTDEWIKDGTLYSAMVDVEGARIASSIPKWSVSF